MDLKHQVYNTITALLKDQTITLKDDMALIGYDSLLDSMKMVELCLMLEELAADHGFRFDWSSDTSIATSRGIFSSVGSLANAFIAQHAAQQES